MEKRRYTKIQKLLPIIQAMQEAWKSHKEIEETNGPALVSFPVLNVEQVSVDCDGSVGQAQAVDLAWYGGIIFDWVTLKIGTVFVHVMPPMWSSTQRMNASLGITIQLPIFREGNPCSCISSYPLDQLTTDVLNLDSKVFTEIDRHKALEYVVGEDRLRDVITQVTILDRTI